MRPATAVTTLATVLLAVAGAARSEEAAVSAPPPPLVSVTVLAPQETPVPPAVETKPASRWHLTLEAMTDFPMDVGVKGIVELPPRIRISLGVGVLPGPYIDALNDTLVALNVYPQAEANLIRAALQESLVARIHAGWRPWERHGFYFEIGYGLVALGGSVSATELLESGTGKTAPVDPNSSHGYDVKSALHMIDAEVGWQWLLPHDLALRASLGFAGTLAAQTSVSPQFTPVSSRAQAQFESDASAALNSIYTSYVFTPVISIACGYRLF